MNNKQKYENLINSDNFELAYRLAKTQGDIECVLEFLNFYTHKFGGSYKTFRITKNTVLVTYVRSNGVYMNFIESIKAGQGKVVGIIVIPQSHQVEDYLDDFTKIVDNILQIEEYNDGRGIY